MKKIEWNKRINSDKLNSNRLLAENGNWTCFEYEQKGATNEKKFP